MTARYIGKIELQADQLMTPLQHSLPIYPQIMDNPLNILLVDDDYEEYRFFLAVLSSLSLTHKVEWAAKDTELFYALEHAHRPDLIIVDIHMPGRDGKECLREIKSHRSYQHIPVIMLTSSMNETDISEAYSSGAHYYAIKPYSHQNYVVTLRKIFSFDWRSAPPVPTRESFVINHAFV